MSGYNVGYGMILFGTIFLLYWRLMSELLEAFLGMLRGQDFWYTWIAVKVDGSGGLGRAYCKAYSVVYYYFLGSEG